MKKIICSVLVLVSALFVLASCGKFTCDACGEEKSGKKHEFEVMGETGTICDDCYEELEEMMGDLEGLE